MEADYLHYLFIAVLIIYITGAIISLITYTNHKLANIIANSFALLGSSLGIVFSLLKMLVWNGSNFSFAANSNISLLSISFYIDNLASFFILIISILALVVSLYSFDYMTQYFKQRNVGYFGFLYNLFILSMIAVVSSGQLFFFIITWELMSLVSYFLVVYEHDHYESLKAGKVYIIMTHIGTAFILAAFILLYKFSGSADLASITVSAIPDTVKSIIFIFLFFGFGTKAGIIPLHIWLPYAHPAAPSNISALMSGVMIKTAVYGIIRFGIFLLGPWFAWWGIVILITGAVSTILGVAYALMEHNLKRLLAYHSIENIGIILIGLGLASISLAKGNNTVAALCLTAALFHTFNHSVFKGLLFLGAGSIHYSTKTKDMEKLGGLIKKMPYTAVFFLVGSLAISAIPPFNGFVSEWLTYQSMFLAIGTSSIVSTIIILSAALLAMAGALAAYCFVKVYGISFLGMPRTEIASEAKEVPKAMLSSMGVLTLLCATAGIFPLIFVKLIDVVNSQLLGNSITGSISGVSSVLFYPVNISKASISPVLIVVLSLVIILLLYVLISIAGKKTKLRTYGTWDCGYIKLNSRMQYTATGFSKPIRIVLRTLFRPQRELQVEEGPSPYFFKSAKYVVSTQSVFEKYLYQPIVNKVLNFSRRTRLLIQTGSIHIYLIYIFIVIVAMFIYYAKA